MAHPLTTPTKLPQAGSSSPAPGMERACQLVRVAALPAVRQHSSDGVFPKSSVTANVSTHHECAASVNLFREEI